MTRFTHRLLSAVTFAPFALSALLVPGLAGAETIVCRSEAPIVKAATIAEDWVPVTTRFQFDMPNNLVPLLETTISVSGTGQSCVVAYFSAVVKPLDNYAVFQVTLDGVPMNGHSVFYAQPDIPVVVVSKEAHPNQPQMIAHQFFLRASPGVHTVTVNVAAGSGFDPNAYPGVEPPVLATVEAPVLSIHYR